MAECGHASHAAGPAPAPRGMHLQLRPIDEREPDHHPRQLHRGIRRDRVDCRGAEQGHEGKGAAPVPPLHPHGCRRLPERRRRGQHLLRRRSGQRHQRRPRRARQRHRAPGHLPQEVKLALILLALSGAASAASFDCTKAATRVEKAICADAEVSRLDELLGRFYFAARERLAENASCLASDQREWIRKRNACADGACLKKIYLERLAELVELQPGMNLPSDLELPKGPALAWAIATPEEMKGDPRAPSKPFRVEGGLVFGDSGYAVRDAKGKEHVLVIAMFTGGATAT